MSLLPKKDRRRLWGNKLACPAYHKKSELAKRAGYFPNLSSTQKNCILQIKAKMKAAKLKLSASTENEDLRILRFLRARNFDINETFTMLKTHVTWEETENYCDIGLESSCHRILECSVEEFFDFFPWWFQGVDKQGRPILWGTCGKLEIWHLTKLTSLESICRFAIWGFSQLERRMAEQSKVYNCNVETAVVVLDAADWHLGLATQEAFTLFQALVRIGSDHFPERLGRLVVINAPSVLSFAWRIVSVFFESTTRSKVQIYNQFDEWFPVLKDIVSLEHVPTKYGGESRDFSRNEAIESLTLTSVPKTVVKTTKKLTTHCPHSSIPISSLEKAKKALELKLSINDEPPPQQNNTTTIDNADECILTPMNNNVASGIDQGSNKTAFDSHGSFTDNLKNPSPVLSSSNLKIINSRPKRRKKSKESKYFITSKHLGYMRDVGSWLSNMIPISGSDNSKRSRRRRRRGQAASSSSRSSDGSESSAISDESDSSCTSGHSSTSSGVYDEEGGNVIHCRSEDNLIPPSNTLELDSAADIHLSWMNADTKWKFNASTQTDESSFDPKFVYSKRSEGMSWSDFFTCNKPNI